MKNLKNLFLVALILFGACRKSEVEDLPINNLEPDLVKNVIKIDSVTQYQFATYKKIHFHINRNDISSWSMVENIVLNRSMGAQSPFNKDSSTYFDLANYPTGPAWIVLRLSKDAQSLSAPSDTFHFIVP